MARTGSKNSKHSNSTTKIIYLDIIETYHGSIPILHVKCDCPSSKPVCTNSHIACINCGVILQDFMFDNNLSFEEVNSFSQVLYQPDPNMQHVINMIRALETEFGYVMLPEKKSEIYQFILKTAADLPFTYPNKFKLFSIVYFIEYLKDGGFHITYKNTIKIIQELIGLRSWTKIVKKSYQTSYIKCKKLFTNFETVEISSPKPSKKTKVGRKKLIGSPDMKYRILEMYDKGMTYGEIQDDIMIYSNYECRPSKATISRTMKELKSEILEISTKF